MNYQCDWVMPRFLGRRCNMSRPLRWSVCCGRWLSQIHASKQKKAVRRKTSKYNKNEPTPQTSRTPRRSAARLAFKCCARRIATSDSMSVRAMESMLAETVLADLHARAARVCWCKCLGCTTREIL